MRQNTLTLNMAGILTALCCLPSATIADQHYDRENGRWEYQQEHDKGKKTAVELGPRPYFLIADMDEDTRADRKLKEKLNSCKKDKFKANDFSIGHRGAAMQFPEHTKESYVAAARMGAGIVECDVTFTKDKALVCRHSQCDLHTTTNILATPLAAKCSDPFTPAVIDSVTGEVITPASAKCCTSDITLEEFRALTGKMDASDPSATTVEAYLNATPSWRTDLYSGKGTLMTHAESIKLFKDLGVKMTPELKTPSVEMPFDGFTQEDYAQKMINEYKAAGVSPRKVYAQSFLLEDVLYWLEHEPGFGKQAVFLDDEVYNEGYDYAVAQLADVAAKGVNIVAPPMWALVELDGNNKVVPSTYALTAKDLGLDIITWTLERSGLLKNGGDWYYQTITGATNNDGDKMNLLHVLAKDVGVLGVFSDWPATTTYYANCMNIGNKKKQFLRD